MYVPAVARFTGKQQHVCLKTCRDIISFSGEEAGCSMEYAALVVGAAAHPGMMRPPAVAVSAGPPGLQAPSKIDLQRPCPLALESILHVPNIGISSRFLQIFQIGRAHV